LPFLLTDWRCYWCSFVVHRLTWIVAMVSLPIGLVRGPGDFFRSIQYASFIAWSFSFLSTDTTITMQKEFNLQQHQ
jgi:hypothetical protein